MKKGRFIRPFFMFKFLFMLVSLALSHEYNLDNDR